MFGLKRGTYLIVCHTYWMAHKEFHKKILVDVTEKEAKGHAALLAEKHRKEFCHADAAAFLLPDTISVVKT